MHSNKVMTHEHFLYLLIPFLWLYIFDWLCLNQALWEKIVNDDNDDDGKNAKGEKEREEL